MGSRTRQRETAVAQGRALTATVLRELRDARLDRNISGATVADALSCSRSRYSRLERGLLPGLTIEEAAIALSIVGLQLSVKVYPGGQPQRDAAHAAIVDRLRTRCHPSIRMMTEAPLPIAGDKRAWDVLLRGTGWDHAVEIETRPRDLQALERRIALKARDGGIQAVSLVLLESRSNRDFVKANASALALRFPHPAAAMLAALRVGADPGPGSVILL